MKFLEKVKNICTRNRQKEPYPSLIACYLQLHKEDDRNLQYAYVNEN